MSDSSRPHGLQPTRLLHLWDFSGKSTGVGCHCLLQATTESSEKHRQSLVFKSSAPYLAFHTQNLLPELELCSIMINKTFPFSSLSFKTQVQLNKFYDKITYKTLGLNIPYVLFKKKFYLLVALCLHCCMWAFSSCGRQASCCCGFSYCGAQTVGRTGFSSCGTQA